MKILAKIGEELSIIGHSVKQKGYGRQALYIDVCLDSGRAFTIGDKFRNVYVKDVFPNVLEHYQHRYYVKSHGIYNEDTQLWTRENGNGSYTDSQMFDSVEDMLQFDLNGDELEIELDENK